DSLLIAARELLDRPVCSLRLDAQFLENPMLDSLRPARSVNETEPPRQPVQHGDNRVVRDGLWHHQPQRKTVFRNVGDALPDSLAIIVKLDRLSIDPNLTGVRRVHSKKRK